jgi:hypothetical protein
VLKFDGRKRRPGEDTTCTLDRQGGGEGQARASERRRKFGDEASCQLGPAAVGLSEPAHVQDLVPNFACV